VQVQRCSRDPRDPQAGSTLKQLTELLAFTVPGMNMLVERTVHVSSLDLMALIRDHLHALASFDLLPEGPPAALSPDVGGACASAPSSPVATAAPGEKALAGTDSAGSTSSTSPATVSLAVMCGCLAAISQLLGSFVDSVVFVLTKQSSASQECVRPLLQLVASPDIVTILVRLTFSPEMRAAAASDAMESSDAAMGCMSDLQQMLAIFHSTTHTANEGHYYIKHTIWQGLQNKMGAILTSEQNAPLLVDLMFLPDPRRGVYVRVGPVCAPAGWLSPPCASPDIP
jgi:hypothetical protein